MIPSLPAGLPEGLIVHCERCQLVVPSDAPRLDGADCELVATHKLAWFNPKETIKGQHTMATATWHLIHHEALKRSPAAGVAYLHQFKHDPKQHFATSATRRAMTDEQVHQQRAMKPARDAHFYAD